MIDREIKSNGPKALGRRRGGTWLASVWDKSKLTFKKKNQRIKLIARPPDDRLALLDSRGRFEHLLNQP